MKKILVAIMALAITAGLASCNKDEDNNTNNNNDNFQGDGITVYDENLGDGLYQPKLHISTIELDGSTVSTLSWNGNQLKELKTNGSNVPLVYNNDGRLKSSSFQGITYNYIYNGTMVSNVRLTGLMGLMANIKVTHTGSHITQLSYDSVSTLYLMQLASEYLDFGIDLKGNSKLSFGDAIINESFDWIGDNVSSHSMTGALTVGISPKEVSTIINVGDLINSFISANYPSIANNPTLTSIIDQLVEYIASDTIEMPVDLEIAVDESYSYDSQRNYMQYFWPMGIQTTNLSANNPVEFNQVVNLNALAHYTLSDDFPLASLLALAGLNQLDIPFSKEISKTSDSYSYQYNSYNFPTTIKSANNGEITIKYN